MVITGEIWKLTGNDRVVGDIAGHLLQDGNRVAAIEGARGRGKSFIAKTVGTLWSENGAVALLAEGDRTMADREYFPFSDRLRLDEKWSHFQAATQVVDMILPLIAIYGFSAQGLMRLFERMKVAALHKSINGLNAQELELLARIDRAAGKKPILLIADNVHWWDRASLEFLYLLLRALCAGPGEAPLAFNVLLVRTDEDEQPAVHGDILQKSVEPFVGRARRVGELSRSDLPGALAALGLGETQIGEDTLDAVWARCGPHLPSLAMVAEKLQNHRGSVDEEAVRIAASDLVSKQLQHPGVTDEVLETIRCAAILGRHFIKGEIICLTQRDPHALDEELRLAEEIRLIENFEGTYSFVHDDWKTGVLQGADRAREELYARLAQCLRSHRSGDYLLRHFAELEARRSARAAELLAAALIQRLRQTVEAEALRGERSGLSGDFGGILTGERAELLQRYGFDRFVAEVAQCYRHLLDGDLEAALEIAEDLNKPPAADLLKAEADYLLALVLLDRRSREERVDAREILKRWARLWDSEPEAGLRLRLLYLYTLAMDKGNESNQRVFDEIEEFCSRNAENEYGEKNAAILSELHVLYRMAPAHFDRRVALRRIKDATRFFGPAEAGSPPKRADEFFRALTNLGSNEVALGRYDAARETLESALTVSRDFPAIARVDHGYALNNRAIGAYRSGEASIDFVLRSLRPLALESERFDMLVTLNYASACNVAGALPEAEAALRRVEEVVAGRRANEPFDMYVFGMARTCHAFHTTGATPSESDWRDLRTLAENIPYPTGGYFVTRHDAIYDLFRQVQPGDFGGFEGGLEMHFPERCHSLDAYYTRGNLLIVIEYWTHG